MHRLLDAALLAFATAAFIPPLAGLGAWLDRILEEAYHRGQAPRFYVLAFALLYLGWLAILFLRS